ncbi:MAG TPA: V-type ATPase subunit [Planctomycetota bacterium]|nr:V-type ATPase subunit [Planctomycetota bacterium]HRR78930.1 V-type ATPase subunit [Planctomycetota bacterium]HRT92792.1 V-type ATPase subunit [Planctomycetota bacterium]
MPLSGDFDYIQAKVHGLRSRVYELDRLDALCDLRTVAQLWHRLYPEADAQGHHELQRRLLADHVAELASVQPHLPEPLGPLYAWMMRRFQVENLKVILRAWKAHEPPERVLPFLAPLRGGLALEAAPLLRAADLASFVLGIPEPQLRAAALEAAPQHAEAGETFFVEAALDAAYYTRLLSLAAELPALHRRTCEPLVRLEAAIYNTLAIFRLKLNYHLAQEKARAFLAQGALHLVQVERLFDYPDFRDMLAHVPRELVRPEDAARLFAIADLERAVWERLLRVANRQFYRSVGDLGLVVAFYTVKRVELANLIRVIEGVRYGLAPTLIREGLIHPRLTAAA